MNKAIVSIKPLHQLLNALNGPGHYIRELQATRGPLVGDDNPINILVDECNANIEAIHQQKESHEEALNAIFEEFAMSKFSSKDERECAIMGELIRTRKFGLPIVYQYFTLEQWKIITRALRFTSDVTPAEVEKILIKCPSASL